MPQCHERTRPVVVDPGEGAAGHVSCCDRSSHVGTAQRDEVAHRSVIKQNGMVRIYLTQDYLTAMASLRAHAALFTFEDRQSKEQLGIRTSCQMASGTCCAECWQHAPRPHQSSAHLQGTRAPANHPRSAQAVSPAVRTHAHEY